MGCIAAIRGELSFICCQIALHRCQRGSTPSGPGALQVTPMPSMQMRMLGTAQGWMSKEAPGSTVVMSTSNSGTGGVAFYRDTVNGPFNWTQSNLVDTPSWRVQCQSTSSGFLTPAIGINGLPRLGTTYNLTLADAVPTSFALMSSGLSDQTYQGLPLPLALPGALLAQTPFRGA